MRKQAQELTILEYFRTADLGKVELLYDLVRDIVKSRVNVDVPAPKTAPKPAGKKRHRRTKAEMEAARIAEASQRAEDKRKKTAIAFEPDSDESVNSRNEAVLAGDGE